MATLQQSGDVTTALLGSRGRMERVLFQGLNARSAALRKSLIVVAGGLAGVLAAVLGFNAWLKSDWYHDPGPYPDGWAGFTPTTFVGLFFFNFCAAVGYTSLYVGVTTGARLADKHPSLWIEAAWNAAQGALAMGSIATGLAGMFTYGTGSFMNCLGIFCVNTNSYHEITIPHPIRDSAGQGWLGVVGFWVFAVLVPVGVVLAYRMGRKFYMAGTPKTSAQLHADMNLHTEHHPVQKQRNKMWTIAALVASLLCVFFYSWTTFWLPDDWEYFTDARFAQAAKLRVVDPPFTNEHMSYQCGTYWATITCPELPWAFFHSRNVILSENLILKLFPSNVFFFCYLLGILAASFVVTHTNRAWAVFWAKPMPPLPNIIPRMLRPQLTRGEFAGVWITKWLLMVFFLYWVHDHNFDGNWDLAQTGFTIGNTNAARWARATGQLATLLLSLLMFAASRQSTLHKLLGTSWESFLWAHRILGYGMLFATFLHIVMWWRQYSIWNIFPAEIFQLPPQNPEGIDNFTVPLIFLTTIVLFVSMGIFALEPVRRRFFELFYYSHLFAAWTTLPVVLWHAASGWEYMLPGLTIWLIDRLQRASRSAAVVQLLSARVAATPDGASSGAVELKFHVDAEAVQSARPGQYVFVNVPEVSIFEWHPFTLSRCASPDPNDATGGNYLMLHIKSMGSGTWTDRLNHLVRHATDDRTGQLLPGCTLTLAVDGPCGTPFEAENYSHVVLVGGGIGITPCAAIFNHFKQAEVGPSVPGAEYTSPEDDTADRRLSCMWPLREEALLDTQLGTQLLLGPSSMCPAAPNVDGAAVPATPRRALFPHAEARAYLTRGGKMQSDKSIKSRSGGEMVQVKHGRPNFHAELAKAVGGLDETTGKPLAINRPVVFACGPDGLVEMLAAWCYEHDVLFHKETFFL